MQVTIKSASPKELLEIQKMHKAGTFGYGFDTGFA